MDDAPLAAYTAQYLRPDGTLDVAGLAKALSCHPDDPLVRIVESVLRMSAIRDEVRGWMSIVTTEGGKQLALTTNEIQKQHKTLVGDMRGDLAQWRAQRDTLGEWLSTAAEGGERDRLTIANAVASLIKDNTALREEIAALKIATAELATELQGQRVTVLDEAEGITAAGQAIMAKLKSWSWGHIALCVICSLLCSAAVGVGVIRWFMEHFQFRPAP